jgi:hypothetical protein
VLFACVGRCCYSTVEMSSCGYVILLGLIVSRAHVYQFPNPIIFLLKVIPWSVVVTITRHKAMSVVVHFYGDHSECAGSGTGTFKDE